MGTRYQTLDLYDRLLDGTFYDHLPYAFYDELEPGPGDRMVRIEDRRPSAQFRLCRMVARYCSRKLFAGRHVPRIIYGPEVGNDGPDAKPITRKVSAFAVKIKFWHTMLAAVLRGSVGSSAVTFEVDDDNDSVFMTVWRSKYCDPTFNSKGDLIKLRVRYAVTRDDLMKIGATDAMLQPKECQKFWYVREWDTEKAAVFEPIPVDKWNPVDGFMDDRIKEFKEWEGKTETYDYGCVPGHWFCNMSGGEAPDGACTFEDAIPDAIDLDYIMSQTGRGVRYNAAPQLAVSGLQGDSVNRGPTTVLLLERGLRDPDGYTFPPGKAELLEMSGEGTNAALTLIDRLRNFALEQISANRKDAEKMKGPLSGRAMEYLDEDANDLIMELRSTYGEYGCLCLLRKIIKVIFKGKIDPRQISLRWPRLYQPTPHDLSEVIPALVAAVYPVAQGSGGGDGEGAPKPLPGMLSLDEARQWLLMNMDLDMMDQPDTFEEPDNDTRTGDQGNEEHDIPPALPELPTDGNGTNDNAPLDQGPPADGNDPGA